jgi:hypothetical protein
MWRGQISQNIPLARTGGSRREALNRILTP